MPRVTTCHSSHPGHHNTLGQGPLCWPCAAWACAAAADNMRAGHPRVTVTRPLQRPCSRHALCHTPAPPPHWSVVPHIVHRCCQAGLRQTTSHQSVRSVASVTLASFSVHCTLYTVQPHLLAPAVLRTHGECTDSGWRKTMQKRHL